MFGRGCGFVGEESSIGAFVDILEIVLKLHCLWEWCFGVGVEYVESADMQVVFIDSKDLPVLVRPAKQWRSLLDQHWIKEFLNQHFDFIHKEDAPLKRVIKRLRRTWERVQIDRIDTVNNWDPHPGSWEIGRNYPSWTGLWYFKVH